MNCGCGCGRSEWVGVSVRVGVGGKQSLPATAARLLQRPSPVTRPAPLPHGPAPVCRDDQWQCDDGRCIDIRLKCNGIFDCPRGDVSDESESQCGSRSEL